MWTPAVPAPPHLNPMIVPNHWAEARTQHQHAGKKVTIRRFGWSDVSEAEALAMAEARAADALRRVLTGEKLARGEPKVAYNGAAGTPIREEVLARHGDAVITRNAYGARCLNSPDALFADIDFTLPSAARHTLVALAGLAALAAVAGILLTNWTVAFGGLAAALLLAGPLGALACRTMVNANGGLEQLARQRLVAFLTGHPDWNLRVYRTPAGYRVLATHQPFEATAPAVREFFTAIGTDPIYVRMCLNQRCFRARLTAKPWRIGITSHLRPRPGVWPVRAEHLATRTAWVADYETRAADYAACRYLESLGSGVTHDALRPVIELHDQATRALVPDAPLA